MSIGRSARLAQMMGLHRQDRLGLDVKQTLTSSRDWTERKNDGGRSGWPIARIGTPALERGGQLLLMREM